VRAKPLSDLFDFVNKSTMNTVTILENLKLGIRSEHAQSFVQGITDTW